MDKEFKVPIKNVYFMLCYAWDVKDYTDKTACGNEEFDNIYNLLASVLVKEVELLLKRGFYKEYIEKEEITSHLKGQINIGTSIQQNTIRSMKMDCIYDEYSEDVLFNQIIKATLLDFLKCPFLSDELQSKIRKVLPNFNNISLINIQKKHFDMLRFHRNNLNYVMIINVCKLFKYGLISNMKDGKTEFADFINDDQMERVYEKFLLNFYKTHLDKKIYIVHTPDIKWKLETDTNNELSKVFEEETNPGERRTDIVIENKEEKTQIIIDAKYYKQTLVKKYHSDDEFTYRTAHLNQIRGYLLDSDYQGKKIGALLYPTLNTDLNKGKVIPIVDTPILIKTVDLSSDWKYLKSDLLSFIHKIIYKE